MAVIKPSGSRKCLICRRDVTDGPIAHAVGLGGANGRDDVLMVQVLLNSVRPPDGGPDLLLAEDGIKGAKTQSAIDKFQRKVLSHPDGRIDASGPTIKALSSLVCDSPAVPPGRLGLVAHAKQKAGSPSAPPSPDPVGIQAVKDGKQALKDLEPRLRTLRFKLTHLFPPTMAFLNKHFSTGKSKVTSSDIHLIQNITRNIHFHVARLSAFGINLIDNVILFDPDDTKNLGWTISGGDKLSTKQFIIISDEGKTIKVHGQSVFLTNGFAKLAGFDKHWTVLHEMSHFVGPKDGSGSEIDDHAYSDKANFLTQGRFFKVHNAETISLFLLEACIGTANVVALKSVANLVGFFNTFPKVTATGDIVTS